MLAFNKCQRTDCKEGILSHRVHKVICYLLNNTGPKGLSIVKNILNADYLVLLYRRVYVYTYTSVCENPVTETSEGTHNTNKHTTQAVSFMSDSVASVCLCHCITV